MLIDIISIHMRMMHSAVLDSGAPLYGRASEAFPVHPLRPGFLADVFPRTTEPGRGGMTPGIP